MFYKKFMFGGEAGEKHTAERCMEGKTGASQEISFGSDEIKVRASDLYESRRGYGFVTEKNRREQELLRFPELNSAFDAVYWYQNQDLTHIQEDASGCFLDSNGEIARLETAGAVFEGERRRIPLSFKVDVPRQGNYRVTVEIRADETMKDVLIFAGRRHLGYRGDIAGNDKEPQQTGHGGAGIGFRHTMTVNVCDIIPRGQTQVYEDKTLDITIVADKPRITAVTVEEAQCPTVFIAGDSTVTDQSADYPYASGTSYSGWGQMLSAYLTGEAAVSNHAHSGLTTHSFREEGHYGIVEKYIRPGDYYFCQFGHNDQKLDSLKAKEGYRTNLLRYIKEAREKGAYPILVTPIARNTWKGNDGSYNDLLEEYAGVCLAVGEQENVPVVDLHGRSMDFIIRNGLEASKAYFFPGDYTHSNDYGAYFMAGLVADEIRRVCSKRKEPEYRFLAENCIVGGFGPWRVPEKIVMPERPQGQEKEPEAQEAPLLSELGELTEPADRVTALDMIIKTLRFFPTNVYNDMFTDVVGHEWYAGTVECAYQNGMIVPELVEKGEFHPLRPVTLEEFLVFAVNGYKSRKSISAALMDSACAYDGQCREFARPYVRAAAGLGLIAPDGSAELDKTLTRGEAVEICRKAAAKL